MMSSVQITTEIVRPGTTPEEIVQQDIRTDAVRVVQSQKLTAQGERLSETKKTDNSWRIPAVSVPKHTSTKSGAQVSGGAGSQIAGAEISSPMHQSTGIHYTDNVHLSATARCCFVSCKFDKAVTVDDGGHATFVGCIFTDQSYVHNAGSSSNVGIVGLKGPKSHVNVTSVFEAQL